MQVAINPKDNNTFATASLDKTVKVGKSYFNLIGLVDKVSSEYFFRTHTFQYISYFHLLIDFILQVWQFGSPTPNFTLEGHDKGVRFYSFIDLFAVLLFVLPSLQREENDHFNITWTCRWTVWTTTTAATSPIWSREPMTILSRSGTIRIRRVCRHSTDTHRMSPRYVSILVARLFTCPQLIGLCLLLVYLCCR